MKNDTVNLLKECDAGVKTAVNSIDEVLDNIHSEKLRSVINQSRREHQELGDEIHRMLRDNNAPGKDPNPMARAMSWMKINWKIAEKPTDSTIANLMYDGCSMGVRSVCGYINQYSSADSSAKQYAKQLVEMENSLMRELCTFM